MGSNPARFGLRRSHPPRAGALRHGVAVAALAIAGLAAPTVAAQDGGAGVVGTPGTSAVLAPEFERADELYFSGRPGNALEVLEETLNRRPDVYGALWRASRSSVARGLMQETIEDQNEWYRRGADYGRRAVAVRPPDRLEGHYWLAANAGLHAIQAGSPGTIAELAEEVHRAATFVLTRDPEHAGAHNVLGQLHFEIMKLSTVERWLGRLLLGADAIAVASWEDAERHLERAARLAPSMIRYRLDLAKLHLRRDRPDPALEQLRAAVGLEPVHPPDPLFRDEARRLLRRMDDEAAAPDDDGWRSSSPPVRPRPPGGSAGDG